MANSKIPGPLGTYPIRIDSGTLSRTNMPQPDVVGVMHQASHAEVDHAKRALAMDIGQLILDITGIFDPSPISDGTNLLISLARGNWVDAVVSAVSIVPYIGDLSKTAKLPRYIKSVRKAIHIAEFDFKWANALRTLFTKLTKVLDECIKLAAGVLPDSAKTQLKELKYEVDKFLDPLCGTTNKLADSGKKADLRPSSNSTKSQRNIDRSKPLEKFDKKPKNGYDSFKNNEPKTTKLDQADELLNRASAAEPKVTKDLSDLAKATGGKQEGLDYRLKTKESLARKLETTNPENINDSLRYTITYPSKNIGVGANKVMKQLENAGYTKVKVKNTFKPGSPYKGINTTFRTPDGQPFELQFHTPESFHAKQNLTHGMYEALRLLPGDSPKAEKLLKEIRTASDENVPIPDGIQEAVPTF